MAVFEYSKYFSELKEDAKKRYEEKMKIADCTKAGSELLFGEQDGSVEWSEWSDVMFSDL